MTSIEYFKLQAKNLLRDYNTKTPYFDEVIESYLYQYYPKYFDIDEIILAYNVDEENFGLMKAQHIIAQMVGYNKWSDLLKTSKSEFELAKLLFDNKDKITVNDWEMYIASVELDNHTTFDSESRLEIFKHIYLKNI